MSKPKRILVVEDTASVRENIAAILRLEGYEVIEASNGEEGIAKALETKPHLIISDVLMPKVSGLEMLETIRKTKELETVPVILLTARAEKSDVRAGMGKGADDYLIKPFQIDELLEAVHRQLERVEKIEHSIQEKIEELRDSLSYSLPHEFRTALNGILGYSELLLQTSRAGETLSPQELEEIGTAILSSGKRLYRLTENFLLYTQLRFIVQNPLEKQRMQAQRTEHAQEAIQEVAHSVAYQYNRTQDLHLDVHNTVTLAIGYQHWYKILYELIDNAFKFSQPGTPVEVDDCVVDSLYELKIRDRGIGMAPEQLEQIEAYKQFGRKEYEQQGLGLGLVIVQILVDLHDGELTLESQPKQGTTVTLRMPMVQE